MAIERKDLVLWVRDYCRQDFYDPAEEWEDATEYEIGDYVVGTNTHTFKAKTKHTSNKNPPPTNTTDWDYTEETLPGGVRIALDKVTEYLEVDLAKQSERLGDYSVTYSLATNWAAFPPHIKGLLQPYRRVSFS